MWPKGIPIIIFMFLHFFNMLKLFRVIALRQWIDFCRLRISKIHHNCSPFGIIKTGKNKIEFKTRMFFCIFLFFCTTWCRANLVQAVTVARCSSEWTKVEVIGGKPNCTELTPFWCIISYIFIFSSFSSRLKNGNENYTRPYSTFFTTRFVRVAATLSATRFSFVAFEDRHR